jgi:hypothetical protein
MRRISWRTEIRERKEIEGGIRYDTGGVGMVGGERWKINWNINNGFSDSVSQETELT